MSLADVENNDLQKYLDSFNKEIDEGSQTTDIDDKFTVDNAARCSVDVDNDEDTNGDGSDEDEGTYFVDQSGNYYYQATKKSLPIAAKPPEDVMPSKTAGKTTSVKIEDINREDDDNDDVDYVLILDGEGKEVYPEELNPDDPEEDKEVYDFDEKDETKELLIPSSVIRLKPNSGDANEPTHHCVHCGYVTNKRYLLSRHLRSHSDDRPHKCSVCERGFKSHPSLINHVNTHLGKKPHPCKHCPRAFATSGELVRHIRYKHTFEKPHKCSECDYASVELSKLKRHIRCHTGERPYQCPHCTYASPDTFKLKRHLRTHTGEKPYECDICHARFTQSNSMKAHRLIHSVGDKPAFQCSLCPTTCGRKTDLRIHIQKLHHSDEPINCKRCGKSFPDRYSYKLHVKTHEGEKCFRCSICPYASISFRHLESHILLHTDQKPFICEICELSFRQKQLLKRHINIYHNPNYVPPKPREKRHTCPHCKRSYSSKGNLMRHMEMHDPESNIEEEKLQLKIGRKYRVSSVDGTVEKLDGEMDTKKDCEGENDIGGDEGDYYEDSEVGYEVIETIDDEEEELERKPAVQNTLLNMAAKHDISRMQEEQLPDIKTVSIKKEPGGKEFVAVEGADGEQYMVVEVIHSDYDEEDEDLEEETIIEQIDEQGELINDIVNTTKTDVDNCFGFDDVDDDEEYLGDPESKETIQLLEISDDE